MHESANDNTKIDLQFERFYRRHFESPRNCRNTDQVRFYLGEIVRKIEEYRRTYEYVPEKAKDLLASYKSLYNRMVHADKNR